MSMEEKMQEERLRQFLKKHGFGEETIARHPITGRLCIIGLDKAKELKLVDLFKEAGVPVDEVRFRLDPDHPDRQRLEQLVLDEIHLELGRYIAAWQQVETAIRSVALSGKMKMRGKGLQGYSIANSKMTDLIRNEVRPVNEELADRLDELNENRNQIMHGSTMIGGWGLTRDEIQARIFPKDLLATMLATGGAQVMAEDGGTANVIAGMPANASGYGVHNLRDLREQSVQAARDLFALIVERQKAKGQK